jgi:hypothetical protein
MAKINQIKKEARILQNQIIFEEQFEQDRLKPRGVASLRQRLDISLAQSPTKESKEPTVQHLEEEEQPLLDNLTS